MAKNMLIDATHPEETRVVVFQGNRLEEFDYESSARRQLKGNIYLAKVTRVEPSLQAAFVDYGGNRHGFLPFSEIHPDYYRIPIADREALIAADNEAGAEASAAIRASPCAIRRFTFMAKNMLIDATHPEETRVVVFQGNRLEEFDYESSARRQLKGNIYLAKVTRVEPSLQAAFVDYGGNRHGFLPFSEIHPDYYRIPIADREALIAADNEAGAEASANGEDEPSTNGPASAKAAAPASFPGQKRSSSSHTERNKRSRTTIGGGGR